MREADLVVVRFGIAGATAAITAARAGASVVVLKKQSRDQHTPNGRMTTGGVVMCVDDVDAATGYLDLCSGGLTPSE